MEKIKELLGTKSHNEAADTHTGKHAAHTIGGEGSHLEQATSAGHAADTTGHSSTATGTAGPHDSSIFNKADLTVDSGYSGTEGLSSGTTGYTTGNDSGPTGHYDQSGASRSPEQSGVSGDHSPSGVTGGHGQSNVIGNLSDVSGAYHHPGLDGDNNTPGVTGSDLSGTQDKSKLNHAEGHSTTHTSTRQSEDLPGHGPDRRNTTSGLHTDPAIHHVKEVGKHNTPPS